MYLAFKNIKNLKHAGKFGPWLHTIVIRLAQNFKNTKSYNNHEAERNLQYILREVISLYYFGGYKIEQIAAFLDVPIGTVKGGCMMAARLYKIPLKKL